MGRAAELVDAHVAETLTYYTFPDCHWIKLTLPSGPLCRVAVPGVRVPPLGLMAGRFCVRS